MKLYRKTFYFLWKWKSTHPINLLQRIREQSWRLLSLSFLVMISASQAFAYDCSAQGEGVDINECNALVALYNSTGGANWSDTPGNNWNITGTPCSNWAGILCNEAGKVTTIFRTGQNLVGTLPSLSVFTALQTLELDSNQLTGSIPNLSALTQLQRLHLSKNQFNGSFPNLNNLTQLQELFLDYNQLTGTIPNYLGTLTQLRWIVLRSNLLSGTIPNLGGLNQLQYLYLGKNTFSGTIPSFLTSLTQLQELDLELTQLTGPIPNLSALTELKIVDLSKNQLDGEIPLSLMTLSKLQEFLLGSNRLTSTCDSTLVAFLDSKSPGWKNQTPEISCSSPVPPPPAILPSPTSQTLTIVKEGTGDGTVKASVGLGNGIDCGTDCTENYSTDSTVQLTAIPDRNSFFSQWKGCSPSLVMTSTITCIAVFSALHSSPPGGDPNKFTLQVTINGLGKITDGISEGINCTRTTSTSTTGKCDVTRDGSVNLTATPATPSSGYEFSNWSNNLFDGSSTCFTGIDSPPTTQPIISVKMDKSRTCTANFKESPKLTVKIEGQGSVNVKENTINAEAVTCQTAECTKSYESNASVTLTAEPGPGYFFQEWGESCTGTDPKVTVTMDQAKTCVAKFDMPQWTFMVYLDADNNLEDAGIDDFLEMAQVGSNKKVNIVVQFDRIGGYTSSEGDWTSCKRFLVKKDMHPTSANEIISNLGECNMGDPNTLKGFINWSTSTYPAHRYALVIWNHGAGWRTATVQQALYKEVAFDDTDGDVLFMKEVKQAINDANTDVNLIGFDACLMGMVEVAYQLKDTGASVLVGSEEVEPWEGWPYDTILADLGTPSNLTPEQLGTAIVERYYSSYGNSETQSAIQLKKMNDLAKSVSTLAETMRTFWASNYSKVQETAKKVIDEIKLSVISEKHGSAWPGSHGLAIYFPFSSISGDYNGSHIDFPANTFWEEFLGDFSLNMKGSWIYAARTLSQQYYIKENIDLYDFCEKLVSLAPSIQSMGSGEWNNPSIWGVWNGTTWQTGVRKPGDTDKVVVQKGHTVWVSSNEMKMDSLFNQGNLLGQDGRDGSGTSLSDYKHATDGGNVVLKVTSLAFNATNGKIKAGKGGDDMTHRSFTQLTQQSIEAKGGKGGSIEIYAPTVINEGKIGPEQKPNYVDSTDVLTSDGGNGGIGSNSQDIIREGTTCTNIVQQVDQRDENVHFRYNSGNAKGGNGGDTKVNGTKILINKGKIASGYGGDARIWWCPWIATAGSGGQVTAWSNGQLVTTGTINGGKGRVLIEPDITLFGNDMRIEDAKEIVIFGGEEWKLNLNNLTRDAISAAGKITLAVGQNGVVDLRNNAFPILKAGQEVQIFADTILFDEGKVLKDIIDAPSIQTHSSKILYEVALSSSGAMTADPGATVPIDVRVINVGPNPDLYSLTLTDSAGWQLGTLPNTVTVEGLGVAELQVSVILPQVMGATDMITVTATSQNDPSVMAKTDIQVTVRSPESELALPSETSSEIGSTGEEQGNKNEKQEATAEGTNEKQEATAEGTEESPNQASTDTPQGEAITEKDVAQIRQGAGNQEEFQQQPSGEKLGGQENPVGSPISQSIPGMDGMSQSLIGWNSSETVPPVETVQIPICPTEGLINWTCHAQGQMLHDLTVGSWGSISNGILAGTLDSQGWVSNLTIDVQGVLKGGIVTGYILNQGTLVDITFVGMMLQGGTLAGTILNESQVGGTLIDVIFAPNAHLKGGKLQGQIRGDQDAPALLESVKVLKGSTLSGVKLGQGVLLEDGVKME